MTAALSTRAEIRRALDRHRPAIEAAIRAAEPPALDRKP